MARIRETIETKQIKIKHAIYRKEGKQFHPESPKEHRGNTKSLDEEKDRT